MEHFDIVVIGAGVVGCAVARELSRYKAKIAVVEKEQDVACGNSSRNTGMLHAGFTYKPGTLKAQCAVEGNKEFDQVARELDVPFKRTGKLVVGFDERDRENILKFKENGRVNGVENIQMLDRDQLRAMAPEAGGEFAMYVPSSGILDPMQYTIALAENAAEKVKTATLLKRALKEIHALGGDYVAVLTGPEKDREHGPSYGERIAVRHKAVVVDYAPQAGNMAKELEAAANEMAQKGWELASSAVTPGAKGILLFRKKSAE